MEIKLVKKLVGLSFIIWEYISAYSPNLAHIFINNYSRPIIKIEIKMTGLSKKDKFIQIGCGSMPYTSLIMGQITGASITGIDIDRLALKHAKKYVTNYGADVKDNFLIEYGNGADYNLSDYDVIMISLGIEILDKVFENILKTAKPEARIIFRNISRDDYENLVPQEFVVENIEEHLLFWESLLLKRRG
jgi:ribosomal protein L11 methylase PrmA